MQGIIGRQMEMTSGFEFNASVKFVSRVLDVYLAIAVT